MPGKARAASARATSRVHRALTRICWLQSGQAEEQPAGNIATHPQLVAQAGLVTWRMAPITAQWLDQTFTSRTQSETVLRPYLEAGTITEHDYSLAVSFLPGRHRYWPVGSMLLHRLVVAHCGRRRRRQPTAQAQPP